MDPSLRDQMSIGDWKFRPSQMRPLRCFETSHSDHPYSVKILNRYYMLAIAVSSKCHYVEFQDKMRTINSAELLVLISLLGRKYETGFTTLLTSAAKSFRTA